jgi:PAS domain S-box-containing protein
MRILYVEDEPRDADITVRMLRKTAPHLQLETVSTVHEALARLEHLARDPLDLVLTDVHLLDGNGLSLLQHIRESSLPLAVVLVTGMGDEETAVAALKARADDYVVKRKDYLDRLPVILESALNHYRADASRRAHPLRVLYAEDEPLDVESTRRHFAVHADHIHIDAVSTRPEALLALQPQDGKARYDVLLMNLHLPALNALEVLRELRLTYQLNVPLVLLCHEGNEELARQGLKFGASSYLVKNPGYLYQLPWELEEAYSRADLLRREAALQASEARNQAILNAIPEMMFLQSRDGTYLDYHARDISLLLAPPEQFLGKNVRDLMPPQLAAEFLQCFEQARSSGQPVLHEYTLQMPDGPRAYEASIVSCNGDKILSIVRDITERKRAADALKESEHQVRLFVEHTPVAVAMFDREMRYLLTSRRWLKDNQLGEQELIGRRHYEVVPDIPERWREGHRRCLAGAVERCEEDIFSHPDGTFDWVRWEIRPWHAVGGEIGGIIMFSEMITERKRAEEALKSALAEVQQLKDRLQEENIYLQEEVRVASNFGQIIGNSPALKRVLRQAEQVALTGATVLILGETGTGKELLAHAIHNLSPRNKHTLVKVNCAALPAPLIESELFGHEKGAFTGATAQRRGRFELADGGTIFLDEVGELPLELQAKLLRVLEDGEFERVGGSRTQRVDVRVVAATNRNLAEAVRKGSFRSDLYYRLNIFPITLPPLCERREDIPMLVTHLVKQLSLRLGKEIETVPQNAMAALQNYHWPGNIRELRNVIERAVIITQGSKLQLIDSAESLSLGAEFQQPGIQFDSQPASAETLEQSEYNLILRTLKQVYWKVEGPGGAAELLKIHPSTLRTRMKKLGITRPQIQPYATSMREN